ncbi:GTPase ObgE [Candidatus Acetothermia bacterium]|nr:GTPase ObgE [Candidatus Acetothermia bacterium]MBI3644196.1 GTPase ObgE [Candidatus Acetothermia bacterium]
MFIDEAKICLVAGRGGDGCISFLREKFRPYGGPDGGHGGRAGSIILQASPRIRTLIHFRDQIHWKAENGGHGSSNKKSGRKGEDLVIKVPVGTVVRDLHSQEVLADLTEADQKVVLVRGGEGGRGNEHFKNSTRQAPRIREKGEPGEERWVKLELKLLADIGLIGCPNAGKSTLLSQISASRPKIAAYPFTTLEPNLGVVWVDEDASFVAVDIPGLIEGAHEGKGLGDRFLKHIERTRILVHLVDISGWEGRDPLDDHTTINHEMSSFSEKLAHKKQIVVGNKMDLVDEKSLKEISKRFKKIGVDILFISAATGEGVPDLVKRCYQEFLSIEEIEVSPEIAPNKEEKTFRLYRPEGDAKDFSIDQEEDGFHVAGVVVNRLSRLSLEEPDAQEYLQEQLEQLGVFAELRRRGAQAGDLIIMGKKEFEYEP